MVIGCLYCCWSRAILGPVPACDVDDLFSVSRLLDESVIGIAESIDGLIGLSPANEGCGGFGQ